MGSPKQAPEAKHRPTDDENTEATAVSPAQRLPTAYDSETGGIQVSTTVPAGFIALFDEVVALDGYSRAEAIREGMRLIMRASSKDAKTYAYVLLKREQHKQMGRRRQP